MLMVIVMVIQIAMVMFQSKRMSGWLSMGHKKAPDKVRPKALDKVHQKVLVKVRQRALDKVRQRAPLDKVHQKAHQEGEFLKSFNI